MTDDKAQELARLEAIEKEMFRAINCLYIAVESSAAQDIQKKAEAYCLAVRALLRSRMGEDRWIPVSERFPTPNAYVWFWVPALCINGAWETGYFRDEEQDRYWECERSDSYNDSIKYDRFQVTHWMEATLPSPPAEEEK